MSKDGLFKYATGIDPLIVASAVDSKIKISDDFDERARAFIRDTERTPPDKRLSLRPIKP